MAQEFHKINQYNVSKRGQFKFKSQLIRGCKRNLFLAVCSKYILNGGSTIRVLVFATLFLTFIQDGQLFDSGRGLPQPPFRPHQPP